VAEYNEPSATKTTFLKRFDSVCHQAEKRRHSNTTAEENKLTTILLLRYYNSYGLKTLYKPAKHKIITMLIAETRIDN